MTEDEFRRRMFMIGYSQEEIYVAISHAYETWGWGHGNLSFEEQLGYEYLMYSDNHIIHRRRSSIKPKRKPVVEEVISMIGALILCLIVFVMFVLILIGIAMSGIF